jgi:predicted kinase
MADNQTSARLTSLVPNVPGLLDIPFPAVDMSSNVVAILDRLRSYLDRPTQGSKIIMLCGIAGSGKSTVAKEIVKQYPSFHRLSTDQIIYETKGLYCIDYPATEYDRLQVMAMGILDQQLYSLIEQKKDVILDRSFWAAEDRRKCYELFDREEVAAYTFVYLRAEKELLWERIQKRRKQGINADSALEISEELFDQYWRGFQAPDESEHPEVIDVKEYHAIGDSEQLSQ